MRYARRRRRRLCSKQSNRESLTVEDTRKPAADQFCKATSVVERGAAEVTAATTTSEASVQCTRTGRSFEAVPLVKRDFSDPDFARLQGIAVQESAVIARGYFFVVNGRRQELKLLASLVNPSGQFDEVLKGEFFYSPFNFLNLAHGKSPAKHSTTIHQQALRVCEPLAAQSRRPN